MFEKLIEEYYSLKEAKELLDYLVYTQRIQDFITQEASIRVDKYYKFDDSE
jgi:hypothetical protein